MADADVNLSFGVGNPDDIARQLETIINKAAKKIGDQLSRAITKSVGKAFQDAFGKINTASAQSQFNNIAQALKRGSKASDEFAEKVEAIRKRNEELAKSFGASGLGGATTKFFDINLRALSALQEQLNRTDLSPELRRQFQLRFDTINSALVKESGVIRRASIVQQQADSEASKAARANLEASSRERIEQVRAQSRQQALLSQQETTRIAAAARLELSNVQTKNRAILINERAAAQQRVAITQTISRVTTTSLRFITQQTQFLSRVAVNAFTKIGQVGTAAFKGITNASKSFFSVLRRSQKDVDSEFTQSLRNRKSASDQFYRDQEFSNRSSARRQRDDTLAAAKQTNDGVLALAKKSGLLGVGAGFVVAAIARRTIREQFAVGGDFVQSLAVLRAQLGLTEEAVRSIREQSLALGNDITLPGVSAKDAADAISLLVKQFGALGDQALPAAQAAARGVLLLSRATNSAAEEAAAGLGAAVNVFGVSADQADKIANQFVQTVSSAAGATFTDLAEAIKGGASVFATFQRPAVGATQALIDFQVAVASLAKGGLVGADAGQALKSLFLTANRSGRATVDTLNEVASRAGVAGSVLFDQSGQARSLFDSLEILRKGLNGLTDAQRASTLQTIFGSRGINAANILIGQSAEEQENLRKAIAESGIAAEIAAAQNTGLRGALDALSSVIETNRITTYEKYQETLGKIVLQFATLLDDFFNGIGVFKLLKPAITGVVAALGGLFIIKGIAELVGLLGRRLRLLFTPLGILLGTVAAIGAAFNVLRKVSQPFQEALSRLGQTFSDLGGRIKQSLGFTESGIAGVTNTLGSRFVKVLQRVGFVLAGFINVFIDKAIPAFVKAARAVRDFVEPAFKAISRVVTDIVVPALQVLVAAFQLLIIPVVIEFGRVVTDKVILVLQKAADAIKSFASVVEPLVRPAIDAFKELGIAIGSAFRGDFSKLLPAVGGIGSGVSETAKNIGGAILSALDTVKTAIAAKFGEIFSPENVFQGARLVLRLVEGLGRILGLVVTDPRLLAAVAAIGAVAAVVAIRFIEGFARGVFTNLGKIANIGVELAKELGKALLSPKNLALAAGAAVVVASLFSLLRPLITSTFTKLGAAGTSSFAAGASASRGGAAGKLGAAGVSAGKSFANGFLSATRNLLSQAAVGITQGGDRVQIRGGTARTFVSALFGGPAALDQAGAAAVARAGKAADRQLRVEWARLSALNRALGRGGLALGFRQLTPEILATAQQAVQPVLDQYGRVGIAAIRLRATFQSAFAGINNVVRGSFALLTRDLNAASREFNTFADRVKLALLRVKAESGTIIKATGRLVATGIQGAIGGVFAGQALGQAESAGGFALGAAGLAATSLAIGAINPAAGVATLGIGLLTAAFTASAKKAQAFKNDVEGVTNALLEAGQSGEEGRLDVIIKSFNAEIFKSARVTDFFNRIQIPTSKFASAILAGGDAAQVLFDQLRKIPSVAATLFRNGISSVRDFLDVINNSYDPAFENVVQGLEEAGLNVDDVADSFESLARATRVTGDAFVEERRKLERFKLEIEDTGFSAEEARDRVGRLLEAQRNLISAQIQDVSNQLSLAQTRADDARRALDQFFGGDYQSSFEGLINRLILDSRSIGDTVAEGLEEGGDIGAARIEDVLQTRLAPQLRELAVAGAKRFGEEFGDVFASPTEGVFAGIDQSEWLKLITIDAATKAIKDPKARAKVAEFIGGLFDQADAKLVVEEVIASSEAVSSFEKEVQRLQTVQLEFQIDSRQLEEQLNIATGELAKIAEAGPSFINLINTGNTLGGAVSEGLTKGLSDPSAIRAVVDAASALAKKIEPEIRRVLRSSSPSRVMISVGNDVAKGLALGIQQGSGQVIASAGLLASNLQKELTVRLSTPNQIVRDLGFNIGKEIAIGIADSEITIGRAVSDAITAGFESFTPDERLAAAIAGGLSEVFKRGLPTEVRATGVTELDLRQAFGGLTPAITGFADSVAQVGRDIENAQKKQREGEPLSATERALAGAVSTSLGADIAGSRNVQAFVTAGGTIREYSALLLQAGRDVNSVAFETRAWRDNLVNAARAAGFTSSEIDVLVRQLGLSNDQIEEFIRQSTNLANQAAQPAVSRREEEERKRKEEDEERERQRKQEEDERQAERDREEREREAEAQRKREEDLRERLRRLEDPRLQRNLVQNINVTVPYGDPQAVALATANRVAATVGRR